MAYREFKTWTSALLPVIDGLRIASIRDFAQEETTIKEIDATDTKPNMTAIYLPEIPAIINIYAIITNRVIVVEI